MDHLHAIKSWSNEHDQILAIRSVSVGVRAEERCGAVPVAKALSLTNPLQVLNDSERCPSLDPVLTVHEGSHLVGKSIGLLLITLCSLSKVLTRKLCNPDVLAESLVPVLEVLLEVITRGAVVVNGDRVELVEGVGASLLKVLVPNFAIGSVGGRGTHEVPSLLLEGEEVLFDELATVLRAHVGLTLLVNFVHGHCTFVLVELGVEVVVDILLERLGVLPAPEHGAVHELVDGSSIPAGGGVP